VEKKNCREVKSSSSRLVRDWCEGCAVRVALIYSETAEVADDVGKTMT
jgi:hypothetical protein